MNAKKSEYNIAHYLGFSNVWLNEKLTSSLYYQSKIFKEVSADAVEFNCVEGEGIKSQSKLKTMDNWKPKFTSIHLPSFSNFSKSSKSSLAIVGRSLEYLFDHHNSSHSVVDGDVINLEMGSWLRYHNIPFAIKNMDYDKKKARLPLEVISLCREMKAPLVLDLQHAFEVSKIFYGEGREVEVAVQLAKIAKKTVGISEIHISGEIDASNGIQHNHSLLIHSTNRDIILKSLLEVKRVLNDQMPSIIINGDCLPLAESGEKSSYHIKKLSEVAIENYNLEKKLISTIINHSDSILENFVS